ncbi:DUF1827 family protein [Enterococcus lemanii]|uniref:DUF1827 family protein n=1 Tax=Enterococcus lemanii TaxID=1159752 RepID=A0ABV9MY66_9ENTE|nr:DUF1827 family protein [Enterococcus lemanii]MBM7708298.1 hypothetical protein [Enterococcus lemanii]
MRLINVTNSYSRLVLQQLENTDAELVKVYTSGSLTIIYTSAPLHNEIVIVNKKRPIKSEEVDEVLKIFLSKPSSANALKEEVSIVTAAPGLVEISIPKKLNSSQHRVYG